MNLDDVLLRSTCLSALGCAWQKVCRHDKKIRLLNFWMHLQQWQACFSAIARSLGTCDPCASIQWHPWNKRYSMKKSMKKKHDTASKCFKMLQIFQEPNDHSQQWSHCSWSLIVVYLTWRTFQALCSYRRLPCEWGDPAHFIGRHLQISTTKLKCLCHGLRASLKSREMILDRGLHWRSIAFLIFFVHSCLIFYSFWADKRLVQKSHRGLPLYIVGAGGDGRIEASWCANTQVTGGNQKVVQSALIWRSEMSESSFRICQGFLLRLGFWLMRSEQALPGNFVWKQKALRRASSTTTSKCK